MKLIDKKNAVLLLCCTLIIFVFHIRNISRLISPSILFDEFGYWTSAALWNGLNWSGVTSALTPYYSYGYGFLLTAVIFLAPNMERAYQTAIVLNSVMVCISFLLSYKVISGVIDKVSKTYILIFCFIAEFYPSIIHHTQFAWSETMIMLCFWLCIFFLYRLLVTGKVVYAVLYGGSCVYIYMIHQRNIAIVVVSVILILVLKHTGHVKGRIAAGFLLTVVSLFIAHIFLKDFVSEQLWENNQINLQELNSSDERKTTVKSEVITANDYEGQIWKLQFIFSLEGMKCLVMGVLGKIYYLGLASMFLVYEGIYYIFVRIKKLNKSFSAEFCLIIFIVGAFLGTLAVSSVFMVYPSRIDTVAYGRYTDCLLGIFIIFGCINLITSDRYRILKRVSIYCSFILIYQLFFTDFIEEYALWANFATCSPLTNGFREYFRCDVTWVPFMAVTVILFGIVIDCLMNHTKARLLGLVLLPLVWVLLTSSSIKIDIALNKADEMQDLKNLILNQKIGQEEIYYIYNQNKKMDIYVGSIQYLLSDITIKCVDGSKVKDIRPGNYIILPSDNQNGIILDESMLLKIGGTANFGYFKRN